MVIFGIPASLQQHRYSPIVREAPVGVRIDWARVFIVAFILVVAIVVNVVVNLKFNAISVRSRSSASPSGSRSSSACRCARPLARVARGVQRLDISAVAGACRVYDAGGKAAGGVVEGRDGPGFRVGVFDNIPLTALALKQGGYDWGFLAYAVGFGGSMLWFGSSAGVALTNQYPHARSAVAWFRHGWHIAVAYVISYLVMVAVLGWHPDVEHRRKTGVPSVTAASTPHRRRTRRAEPIVMPIVDDIAGLRRILTRSQSLAVVGISANWYRPSFFAAKYMQDHGYRIHSGQSQLLRGSRAALLPGYRVDSRAGRHRRLLSQAERDRAARAGGGSKGAKVLWMQLGIHNDEAAKIATDAGLDVVMNRCVKIEHARILGGLNFAGVNTGVISARRPVRR
jgi:predicted CoA-binding protein